ncbi:MAG: TlpA family protein disulfide reductase [Cytophagales bacterium]|nr:TlpA family protein disulfide reductase [Cytophagales bacterium]
MRLVFLLLLLTILYSNNSFSYSTISVKLGDNKSKIKYFKPYDGFSNFFIPECLETDINGNLNIKVEISEPTFVNIVIDNFGLWLLLEPNDGIRIERLKESDGSKGYLEIFGKNYKAHRYYNYVYNKYPIDKIFKIREIFTKPINDINELFESISSEINKQTNWVDSLQRLNQASKPYCDLMKVEISSTIAWEIGNLIDNSNSINSDVNKLAEAKKRLFKLVSPTESKLKYCGYGSAYYYTYYEYLFKHENYRVDTSKVIIDEVSFYALAPFEIQRHLWGQDLFVYKRSAPTMYDYCNLFKKFKRLFEGSDYVKYFETSNICKPLDLELKTNIVGVVNDDLFSFISSEMHGKRILIDLWATWCGPCKIEFSYFDYNFYKLVDENDIELLFISIDKESKILEWENYIKKLELKGTHILAGEKMLISLKDIFFNDKAITIPRYVLFNESGVVISEELVKPSDKSFKDIISKSFKN